MDKFLKKKPREVEKRPRPSDKADQIDTPPRKKSRPSTTHFLPVWVETRPWLSDGPEGMTCLTCIKYCVSSSAAPHAFVRGSRSYKIDTINKHAATEYHKFAIQVEAAKCAPIEESPAAKLVRCLTLEHKEKLDKLFTIVHALVQNNRPLSDFVWQCQLHEINGVDLGKTYRNRSGAHNFLQHIAKAELVAVSKVITDRKFLCVIGDGSTDAATQEQELWYARTAFHGVVNTYFFGVATQEKADAVSIVNGLKQLVTQNLEMTWSEFVSKAITLSCDGANVMVGQRAGVGALIRQDQPELLTLHCMAHRLELAFKDATRHLPLHDKAVNVLMMGIYYFYSKSALNRSMLRRTHTAMSQTTSAFNSNQLLLPTRVGGTRWVSHLERATTNFLRSYEYIATHLIQLIETRERVSASAAGKAKAFLRLMESAETVAYLHHLRDVLVPLSLLSKQLQGRHVMISEIHAALHGTINAISMLKDKDGMHLREVIGCDTFKGVALKYKSTPQFNGARVTLIASLEQCLRTRFIEFGQESSSVIRATVIGNFSNWPRDAGQLCKYGDNHVDTLTTQYVNTLTAAGVDVHALGPEWALLKTALHDGGINSNLTWEQVNRQHHHLRNILGLMDLVLTMSPTSAEAERGFSQLKLIKNVLRSRMTSETLNDCMAVKLLSKKLGEYNPEVAILRWMDAGNRTRRPAFLSGDSVSSSSHDQTVFCYSSDEGSDDDDEISTIESKLLEFY